MVWWRCIKNKKYIFYSSDCKFIAWGSWETSFAHPHARILWLKIFKKYFLFFIHRPIFAGIANFATLAFLLQHTHNTFSLETYQCFTYLKNLWCLLSTWAIQNNTSYPKSASFLRFKWDKGFLTDFCGRWHISWNSLKLWHFLPHHASWWLVLKLNTMPW